jgi:Tol biopolymer transport system component
MKTTRKHHGRGVGPSCWLTRVTRMEVSDMRRILTAVVVIIVVLAGGVIAQQKKQQDIDLQTAIRTETVDGDLQGAIKQYAAIVAKYTADRAVTATALVHMAECYQKLGDTEAHKIYERLVRDFADQKEPVAIARAHLGRGRAIATPAGMTSRRLWTTPHGRTWDFLSGATISPDGRFLSYIDWETGDLALHEFATGSDRRLTNNRYQNDAWAEESAISRDGKHVAYSWFKGNGKNRFELRVASLDGASVPQSRLLFDNEDIEFLMPCDWSPDGNWIAVELHRADKSRQMGLISVRDGSLRVLKSSEWSGSIELFFSPDGRYLGFDAPVGDAKAPRDVFIIAVDGSRQIAAATGSNHDTMMGWSPDGKQLLFASDRGGTVGLWAVPVGDGRPQGMPELMKSDISRFSLGVSASGSLYMGVPIGNRDIQVASVDFETGKLMSGPVRPVQTFVGTNSEPAWSPDGKYLAYKSNRPPPSYNGFLGIQSVETGQVRELQPNLTYFQNIRWAPDGGFFIVGGKDLKGRQGQYQIDAQTGDVTPFAGRPSPDAKKIYTPKDPGTDGFSLIERDLASGKEREIKIGKSLRMGALRRSPDGRFFAAAYNDGPTRSSVVLLIPIDGGEPRELLRVRQPQSFGPGPYVEWMADGRAVLVNKFLNDGRTQNELWLVPVSGQPRQIDIGASKFEGVPKVHPDGRRVAYVAGERKADVWVLESFLPALNPKK